jgi:hypothetical protein
MHFVFSQAPEQITRKEIKLTQNADDMAFKNYVKNETTLENMFTLSSQSGEAIQCEHQFNR